MIGLIGVLAAGLPNSSIAWGAEAIEEWVERYSYTDAVIYNAPYIPQDEAIDMVVDSEGNIYVTGNTYDSLTDYDYTTVKYDREGNMKWVTRYDGPGNDRDEVRAIAVDSSGHVYVTGSSYGLGGSQDYATVKYRSSDGSQEWVQRYNGPANDGDQAFAITTDNDGYIYVTGGSTSSSGRDDYYTIKYDSEGQVIWSNRYDGDANSFDYPSAIAVDGSGNVYVAGASIGFDFDYATVKYRGSDGYQEWVSRYNGPDNGPDYLGAMVIDDSGDVYVTGAIAPFKYALEYYDVYTVKYSGSDGSVIWAKRYNGSGNSHDSAYAMAIDNNGDIYVSGESVSSSGSRDYGTIKYRGSDGNQEWVRYYNGLHNDRDVAGSVAIDDSGNLYVAGWSYRPSSDPEYNKNDITIVKYSSVTGNEVLVSHYVGTDAHVRAMAIDSNGYVYVTCNSVDDVTGDDYVTIKYDFSTANYIPADTGGTVSSSDGSVEIDVPAGALDEDTILTVEEKGISELTTNQGKAVGVFSVEIGPAGTTFDPPATITLHWPDENNDGLVDGTSIHEANLRVTKDNVAITDQCKQYMNPNDLPYCDTTANTFSFEVSSLSVFVLATHVPSSVTAEVSAESIVEGSSIRVSGTFSDPDGEPWVGLVDFGDGSTPKELSISVATYQTYQSPDHVYVDEGTYTGTVIITDNDVNTGTVKFPIEVINAAPVIESITPSLVEVNTAVEVSAVFSDAGTADTHTASFHWGDGDQADGEVTESHGAGSATASHTYAEVGVYTVTVTVTDDDGGETREYQYIAVFDRSAGFVTGGGWIDSPAGAYTPVPELSGKASFGFYAKYGKGMNIPDGSTQFQFKAGDFNFHSNTYDWLVVAGARVQFKGTGTVNGVPGYGFLLTAIDGEVNGGGGTDKFRIKVWESSTEKVIYDNQLGAEDDSVPLTPLGGGSIIIHSGK